MPGIRISSTTKAALPEQEREGIDQFLWHKSAGECFLCGRVLNRASDSIEADHDKPSSVGGPTNRTNLNLVHASCNRFKRNNPSVNVRPYLHFQVFLESQAGPINYATAIKHFDVIPKPTTIELHNREAHFEFSDGSIRDAPLMQETNRGGDFRFTFVEVPRDAIWNDDRCQPRTIKLQQIWALYSDIEKNPLHEPPGCRLVPAEGGTRDAYRLAMFDGQHKSIAMWMHGRELIPVKVYINLSDSQAIQLVNSIQAKIKKLPLSPFELAAKLSDEWRHKLEEYEESVGSGRASEKGFFEWLPVADRARAKQAFRAALVQDLLDQEALQITKFVQRAGGAKGDSKLMTEGVLKGKVLDKLLHLSPLEEPSEDSQVYRLREQHNVTTALNYLTELAFEPQGGSGTLTEKEKERRRRMTYQSALAYISHLIKEIFRHVLSTDVERPMFEKAPSEADWEKIKECIRRLVDHPIWVSALKSTRKLRAVDEALSKNQDAHKAFSAVGLRVGYVVGADTLPSDWAED